MQSLTSDSTLQASTSIAPKLSFKNKSLSPLVSMVTVCSVVVPSAVLMVHVMESGRTAPGLPPTLGTVKLDPTDNVAEATTALEPELLPVSEHETWTMLPSAGMLLLPSAHAATPPTAPPCVFELSPHDPSVMRNRTKSMPAPVEH